VAHDGRRRQGSGNRRVDPMAQTQALRNWRKLRPRQRITRRSKLQLDLPMFDVHVERRTSNVARCTKGGEPVLAGKLKQSEGPGLFLLSSRTAGPDAYADLVAHRRLRVRRWEARRAWAGRL